MPNLNDLDQLDLRIATIIKAEKVPETNKLLRLIVDLGDEQRQIIAGLAENFSPDELINSQVLITAGLEPVKLKGLESQGMILATKNEDHKPILIKPTEKTLPGAKIS